MSEDIQINDIKTTIVCLIFIKFSGIKYPTLHKIPFIKKLHMHKLKYQDTPIFRKWLIQFGHGLKEIKMN